MISGSVDSQRQYGLQMLAHGENLLNLFGPGYDVYWLCLLGRRRLKLLNFR